MTQVVQYPNTTRRSLAAAAEPTTEEIQERRRRHIAEIVIAAPQSEDLTYEQKQWLYFRMARPFPKPYRPYKPIVIPYRWQERAET